MRILDGTGRGYEVGVNSENRLQAACVSASIEHHINHHEGEAYNVYFAVNPDGGGDCFFYMLNDSNKNMDISIEGLWIQTSAAEEISYYIGQTGVAVATSGAALTPQNVNAGSGNVAGVTCYGNVADGAVDITGLTGGRLLNILWLTNTASQFLNFEQDVIIPPNQAFSMYAIGGDTLLRGCVCFNFHESTQG